MQILMVQMVVVGPLGLKGVRVSRILNRGVHRVSWRVILVILGGQYGILGYIGGSC